MHTCRPSAQRNPLHCFLPPYILENIVENGTPEQRAIAQLTLQTSEVMRQQREAVAKGEVPSGAKAMTTGPGKERYIYTANNGSTLPGQLIRQEGGSPCNDPAADEAYDGSGETYDLFWNHFQRDSIDGQGLALISTVHYQNSYDNAFWNGSQMVYGDGDEDMPPADRLFNRFTIAIDIMGHELTHGVTSYEANLNYYAQPGALNESMSDVFGSLVKQQHLNQTARQADWIIGEGLFTTNVNGVGIRSMKAPGSAYNDPVIGKDPQPGHMNDYVNTTQDSGGVHINSGIPNRAFYVAAFELDGFAWEKAGKIWYEALTNRLTSTSSFQDAANLTYAAAGDLYGANSLEQLAVQKGWSEVGIQVGVPSSNPGCLQALLKMFKP
jgi:Zn-dependent metalloprotease